jgi:DNA-binding beta-propeller fold protein YncE
MRKKNAYLTMVGIFVLITAGFFLYTYLQKQDEMTVQPTQVINENAKPNFAYMIYGGFGPDALNKAMDVAVIGQFIYVTDTNNKRVQVFDQAGNPLFRFGGEGEAPGKFKFPYGIAGDKNGNVYVADLYNSNISIFDSKGKFIKYFVDGKSKLLQSPGGLRIFNDRVYVTDIQKSKLFVFDMQGKKVQEIGQLGQKPGQFRAPNAVTLDRDGNIYVTDTGNQRVEMFDKTGKFKRIFNGTDNGQGDSVFVNPRGIGVDSRGILYVVSNLTHFIYGFDKDGKKVFIFGGSGDANDQFSLPNGLFIDENDQVYITDTMNQRVAVYK